MAPEGFFAGSPSADKLLTIVRGLDLTAIGQMHQSLFNPDLIREAIAGDPNGEVMRAAEVVSLDKVLDSGPAPAVSITSPADKNRAADDLVTVVARITDRGKGVGRIEWRINGVTAAVTMPRAKTEQEMEVTERLALDPGENIVEVIAYNGSNLLASLPARATISYAGAAGQLKPNLHVLAFGINKYIDVGWVPPGTDDALIFKPLNLAVDDARAVAEDLKKAAGSQYADVKITLLTDEAATRDGIERAVERLAGEVLPRDTFVFFGYV
jgi:hypothetical protein